MLMIEIRLHGRGGQGAVTAAYLLAKTMFYEGWWVQAFPNFGVERRGAPVESYVRIDKSRIKKYYNIHNPDMVIVLDPTLDNYASGIKKGGKAIVNTTKPVSIPDVEVHTIDVVPISKKVFNAPIFNTPMLGAFLGATKLADIVTLHKVMDEVWHGDIANKNKEASWLAYKEMVDKNA